MMSRAVLTIVLAGVAGACTGDSGTTDSAQDAGAEATLDLAADSTDGLSQPADAGAEPAVEDTAPDPAVDTAAEDVVLDEGVMPTDQGGACERACSAVRPVILVHGINGSSENFETMRSRLIADGWPEEYIFTFDAADPDWGCNVDNAAAIRQLVVTALESTCESRVDLIAHSMGTLSSRYFLKNLDGHTVVNTFVTLGGMNHGLQSPCFAPDFLGVCVWQELCESGDFIAQLNADPATPGSTNWVSIYGTADSTVPNESSYLEGAENIAVEGVEHSGPNGLLEREDVYEEVLRVLQYPCW